MDKQYVVLSGSIIDGISPWGPFDSGEEACDWANENLNEEWVYTELLPPSEAIGT